jgi:DNA-binding response OmpR family regulator
LDLVLPGISGTETARELRSAGILPAAPLIITTALGHDEAQAAAKSSGACAVLVKPFDFDLMLTTVDEALSASTRQPASSRDPNPPPLPASPPLT